MNIRRLRNGVAALSAVIGLLPAFTASQALAVPSADSAGSANPPAATRTTTLKPAELAIYREALLNKQSTAIAVQNATIEAIHAQTVAELGYEPATTDQRVIAGNFMMILL